MADTMSGGAPVGALSILTLTFVPKVMCSYWFKKGVRERAGTSRSEWIKEKYGEELTWVPRPSEDHDDRGHAAIFGATLLLVPFIGGEFMPHLDEGAVGAGQYLPCARFQYREASKFAPQIRALIAKYPQVTEVGSELGRPDDGTDPTGFFNCEFYVGLKPPNDPSTGKKEFRSR